jgi:polysaccharide deacetylase 2 family uncharacterized protein YibQ
MAAETAIEGMTAGRRMAHPLALAYFALFAGLLLVIGGVAIFGRSTDGSPSARIDLGPRPHRIVAAKPPPVQPQQPAQVPAATPAEIATPAPPPQAAVQPQTTPEPALPPALVPGTILKPVFAGHALVADPALIEQTNDGPLPRIADDGRTPMSAYAPAVKTDARPRIALVITGLGISAKETAAAIQQLPAGVTLAFAPYDEDVQRWVGQARATGHEVLLEVPMEPYDFPDSDPGPHTLRSGSSEDANIRKLTWSLTRFTGYAGITNLLGSRFLADQDSLSPVMTFLQRRGLLFFDSGSTTHSAAPGIAHQTGAPYVQSVSTIDTIQTGMEIDRRLSDLESRARLTGAAAGAGFLYPVTIGRVADWAKGLQGRGFVLVPASAIIGAGK